MRLSHLNEYLRGVISTECFLAELSSELSDFSSELQERGRPCSVVLTEDVDMTVKSSEVLTLCNRVIHGSLHDVQLDHIITALELSDRVEFASDEIREYIFEMGAPEINGVFTQQRAAEISRALIV